MTEQINASTFTELCQRVKALPPSNEDGFLIPEAITVRAPGVRNWLRRIFRKGGYMRISSREWLINDKIVRVEWPDEDDTKPIERKTRKR